MKLKPSPPAFLSRAIANAMTALAVIILLPVMMVLTLKVLDKIGWWLALGLVVIALVRILVMLIARRRQKW